MGIFFCSLLIVLSMVWIMSKSNSSVDEFGFIFNFIFLGIWDTLE
jgi:hypothetical protein